MRLFIAINFENEVKQKIIALQQQLGKQGSGNFSRPENLHLTLAFLGEVSSLRIITVKSILNSLTVRPITLTFNRTGFFKREGGDIIWLGISENRALNALQSCLTSKLNAEGFKTEKRTFEPHLTLVRQYVLNNGEGRINPSFEHFTSLIDTVSLMVSERLYGRLVYREIYRKST